MRPAVRSIAVALFILALAPCAGSATVSQATKGRSGLGGTAGGGVIQLAALGAIQVDGLLFAKAAQASSFGGEIDLLGLCTGGLHDGAPCAGDIPDCGTLVAHGTCTGGDR